MKLNIGIYIRNRLIEKHGYEPTRRPETLIKRVNSQDSAQIKIYGYKPKRTGFNIVSLMAGLRREDIMQYLPRLYEHSAFDDLTYTTVLGDEHVGTPSLKFWFEDHHTEQDLVWVGKEVDQLAQFTDERINLAFMMRYCRQSIHNGHLVVLNEILSGWSGQGEAYLADYLDINPERIRSDRPNPEWAADKEKRIRALIAEMPNGIDREFVDCSAFRDPDVLWDEAEERHQRLQPIFEEKHAIWSRPVPTPEPTAEQKAAAQAIEESRTLKRCLEALEQAAGDRYESARVNFLEMSGLDANDLTQKVGLGDMLTAFARSLADEQCVLLHEASNSNTILTDITALNRKLGIDTTFSPTGAFESEDGFIEDVRKAYKDYGAWLKANSDYQLVIVNTGGEDTLAIPTQNPTLTQTLNQLGITTHA